MKRERKDSDRERDIDPERDRFRKNERNRQIEKFNKAPNLWQLHFELVRLFAPLCLYLYAIIL